MSQISALLPLIAAARPLSRLLIDGLLVGAVQGAQQWGGMSQSTCPAKLSERLRYLPVAPPGVGLSFISRPFRSDTSPPAPEIPETNTEAYKGTEPSTI
eukprot:gene23712-9255_t